MASPAFREEAKERVSAANSERESPVAAGRSVRHYSPYSSTLLNSVIHSCQSNTTAYNSSLPFPTSPSHGDSPLTCRALETPRCRQQTSARRVSYIFNQQRFDAAFSISGQPYLLSLYPHTSISRSRRHPQLYQYSTGIERTKSRLKLIREPPVDRRKHDARPRDSRHERHSLWVEQQIKLVHSIAHSKQFCLEQ